MTGKEIIRTLKAQGWIQDVGGRHVIMKKDKRRVPIPAHGSRDIPTGTLKAIEKATGVKLS